MSETTFAQRIEIALNGEKPGSFARRTGIGDSALRKYLGGTIPAADKADELAQGLGVNLEWLVANRGPKTPERHPIQIEASDDLPDGYVAVPRLEIRPSAGPGSLVSYDQVDAEVAAFREQWLRKIGVSPKNARLMVAKGDSMRETINDGDLMIVDVSIREIVNGAIHVLVYGGMVILKRLQVMRNGVLLLKSDNPLYDTEEVPLQEQPELIIEGRVLWAGGSL